MKTMKQEIKAYRCTMIDTDSSIYLHHDPKKSRK
jgi:hypothetical protein